MSNVKTNHILRTLPWGEEVYMEIPLHKNSSNKFYARHGRTGEGREYIEFSKFGPKPNAEHETYLQKLRLYGAEQWSQIKYYVECDLAPSAGWNVDEADEKFAESLKQSASKAETSRAKA